MLIAAASLPCLSLRGRLQCFCVAKLRTTQPLCRAQRQIGKSHSTNTADTTEILHVQVISCTTKRVQIHDTDWYDVRGSRPSHQPRMLSNITVQTGYPRHPTLCTPCILWFPVSVKSTCSYNDRHRQVFRVSRRPGGCVTRCVLVRLMTTAVASQR